MIGATPTASSTASRPRTLRAAASSSWSSTAWATGALTSRRRRSSRPSARRPTRAGAPRRGRRSSRTCGFEVDDRRAVHRVEPHDLDAARGDRAQPRRCVSPRRFGRSFARWAKIPTRGHAALPRGCRAKGAGGASLARSKTKSTSTWLKPSRPTSASSGTASSSSIAQRSCVPAVVEQLGARGAHPGDRPDRERHQYPHRSSASSRDCQFGSTTTRSSR